MPMSIVTFKVHGEKQHFLSRFQGKAFCHLNSHFFLGIVTSDTFWLPQPPSGPPVTLPSCAIGHWDVLPEPQVGPPTLKDPINLSSHLLSGGGSLWMCLPAPPCCTSPFPLISTLPRRHWSLMRGTLCRCGV